MKQLQCNFTTPEQSKRLLELGVPSDSADCYWFDKKEIFFLQDKLYSDEAKDGELVRAIDYTPCWSVGRLIEILKECINNEDDLIDIFVELQYSNDILTTILMIFRDNKAILDFSKLEE